MTQQAIGKAIKQWRTVRGLSQRGLAERTGLHHVHIGRLERGQGNPTVATLETLAKVLGKRVGHFFTPPAQAKRPAPQRARRR